MSAKVAPAASGDYAPAMGVDAKGADAAWLAPTLLAVAAYTGWVLCSKLSNMFGTIPPSLKLIIQLSVQLSCSAVIGGGVSMQELQGLPVKSVLFVALAGACGAAGGIFFQKALALGDASTVTAVSGLYPAVVFVICAALMGEEVTAYKVVGVLCALGSGFCFAQ